MFSLRHVIDFRNSRTTVRDGRFRKTKFVTGNHVMNQNQSAFLRRPLGATCDCKSSIASALTFGGSRGPR